jgi:hypothetical protein
VTEDTSRWNSNASSRATYRLQRLVDLARAVREADGPGIQASYAAELQRLTGWVLRDPSPAHETSTSAGATSPDEPKHHSTPCADNSTPAAR